MRKLANLVSPSELNWGVVKHSVSSVAMSGFPTPLACQSVTYYFSWSLSRRPAPCALWCQCPVSPSWAVMRVSALGLLQKPLTVVSCLQAIPCIRGVEKPQGKQLF